MGHTPSGGERLEVGVTIGAASEPEERKLTGVRPEDDECCPSIRRSGPSPEVSTRGKLVLSSAPGARSLRAAAGGGNEPRHAGRLRALVRSGCAQADGGRLYLAESGGWHGATRGAHVRDDDGGTARPRGLVERPRGAARGAGVDGRVLAAGVHAAGVHAAGGRTQHPAGQSPAPQARPRTQDRRQRCRVAGRPPAPWVAHCELHSAAAHTRRARADTLSQDPGPGARPRGFARAERAGERQPHVGLSGDRRAGQERPGDARGAAGRRARAASKTPRHWPSWPAVACGRSCPNCFRR